MKRKLASLNLDYTTIISYAGLVVVFFLFWVILGNPFVSWINISSIIDQAFTVFMMGLGAVFVFGFGGTNLAVNGGLGFTAVCIALVYQRSGIPLLSLPVSIVVSTLAMYVIGWFIAATNMNAFVCTMCFNNVFAGILQVVVSTKPIPTPSQLGPVVDTAAFKLVTMLVCTIISWYALNRTIIGKNIKAMGCNLVCSSHSGVNVNKYKRIAFICSGLSLGLASFFYAVRVNAVSSYAGNGSSMEIIVMAVLGGLALSGGAKTRVSAVVVGAFTLSILGNGLVRMGADASTVQLIKGIVFLLIILFTYERPEDFVYS